MPQTAYRGMSRASRDMRYLPLTFGSFSAGVSVIRKCAALILPAVLPQNKKFILRNMRFLCWNGGFNRRFAGYIHLSIHFITK